MPWVAKWKRFRQFFGGLFFIVLFFGVFFTVSKALRR